MKFCSQCGQQLPDEHRYCGRCGAAVPEPKEVITKETLPGMLSGTGQDIPRQSNVTQAKGDKQGHGSHGGRKRLVMIGSVIALLLVAGVLCGWWVLGAESRVQEKLDLAVKYLSENKFEEAILAYREAIKLDPKNPKGYKGLCVAYSMQGKTSDAEQVLRDGLEKVEDKRQLKLVMAAIMSGKGQIEGAEQLYREIISENDKFYDAYRAYSKFLIDNHRDKEAMDLLSRAAANTGDYRLFALLAEYYLNYDPQKSSEYLVKSIDIMSKQFAAFRLLEFLYIDKWFQLTDLGDRLIGENSIMTGNIIKLQGFLNEEKYGEVESIYSTLPSEVKASARTKLIVARAYGKLGKKDEEKKVLNEIKVEDIVDADFMGEIALTYLELGEKDKAIKLALRGVELDSEAVESYKALYLAYEKDDKDQAVLWNFKYKCASFFEGNKKDINVEVNEDRVLKVVQEYFLTNGTRLFIYKPEYPYESMLGKNIISIDNIWDGKAVVRLGPFASEWTNEIGVSKVDGKWRVSYVDSEYYSDPLEYNEAIILLANQESYKFEDKPGGYKYGIKSENPYPVIVLVAPYGEHWKWQYIIERTVGQWRVVSKEEANEPGQVR